MAISWIKSDKDTKSFKVFKNLGLNVIELNNLDDVDKKIQELIDNKYNQIIISNEVAGFSTDIIKKYSNNENVNIIIAASKRM